MRSEHWLNACAEPRLHPELEIFDLGMANMLAYLLDRQLIGPPCYANLLFGNLASAQARFIEIGALVSALPPGVAYCMAGLGHAQLPIAAMAAAAAPGVRIRLEDNLWLDPLRRRPATNLALVEKAHDLAALMGRKVMAPAELRRSLGLERPR